MDGILEFVVEAAYKGDTQTIQSELEQLQLEERIRCINSVSINGQTALLAAVEGGHIEAVKLLVEKYDAAVDKAGIGPTEPDYRITITSVTPLWLSVYSNNTKVTEYLLEKSADVNKANDAGDTPLTEACCRDLIQTAAILLRYGAKVDHQNFKGITPLMYSCYFGYVEMSKFLFDNGAGVEKRSELGMKTITL